MQSLARNGYTAEEVRKALHSPSQTRAFKYELLDKENKVLGQLDNILAASVANNTLAQIKRTGRFQLIDTGEINFLNERIRPWVRVKMPDNGFADFPQGVLLLSTPPRKVNSGRVERNIQAYDQLLVLRDHKMETRYTVTKGTKYTVAVSDLLSTAGITQQNITASDHELPSDRDWPPGASILQIIGDLLSAINYRSLYIDEYGYAVAQSYVSPSVRASEYTYSNGSDSVMFPGTQDNLDLFSVPNRWLLAVSSPDLEPMTASYTNDNPNSPTSTVSRGMTITDHRIVEAANQETLNQMVLRIAFQASQVYQHAEFSSLIMPMHSDADVITLQHSVLGISAKFSETSWEFELKHDAQMRHQVRRVVNI